jgi:hypothetical protein
MALDSFLDRFPEFLMFGGPIWALSPLLQEPVEMKLIGWVGDEGLYSVTSISAGQRESNTVSH